MQDVSFCQNKGVRMAHLIFKNGEFQAVDTISQKKSGVSSEKWPNQKDYKGLAQQLFDQSDQIDQAKDYKQDGGFRVDAVERILGVDLSAKDVAEIQSHFDQISKKEED